jgi:hypothetical protein
MGVNGSIGDDRVATASVRGRHGARVVSERSIGLEGAVLEDDGEVIHAICLRQREMRAGSVINDDHPGQAHIDLPGGVVMRMGVEPIGRGGLIDLEREVPDIAGFYRLMGAAVDVAGY